MKTHALLFGVLTGLVMLPPDGHAGVLAPTNASNLVEAYGDVSTPCTAGAVNSAQVNVLEGGDNTTTAFSIPAGMVLVITDLDISSSGTAGDQAEIRLFRQTPPAVLSTLIAFEWGTFDSHSTFVSFHRSLGSGAIVKSGTSICAVVNDVDDFFAATNPSVIIHGYFAKDK